MLLYALGCAWIGAEPHRADLAVDALVFSDATTDCTVVNVTAVVSDGFDDVEIELTAAGQVVTSTVSGSAITWELAAVEGTLEVSAKAAGERAVVGRAATLEVDIVGGGIAGFPDLDGDGFGAGSSEMFCVLPSSYTDNADDCDDTDANVAAGLTWYEDTDRDHFGGTSLGPSCTELVGAVLLDGDCDDGDELRNPDAVEICDEVDNDCDGLTDDADPTLHAPLLHFDGDGDGFGSVLGGATLHASDCAPVAHYVAEATDCDDEDAARFPGAVEVCHDDIDNDCDGDTDLADVDFAPRVLWLDADLDGFGDPQNELLDAACQLLPGYVDADPANPDCDDGASNRAPGLAETCDGVDNNCSGITDDGDPAVVNDSDPHLETDHVVYLDLDEDGFGSSTADLVCTHRALTQFETWVPGDCLDGDASVFPGAADLCFDNLDNDCDGTVNNGIYTSVVDAHTAHTTYTTHADLAAAIDASDAVNICGVDVDFPMHLLQVTSDFSILGPSSPSGHAATIRGAVTVSGGTLRLERVTLFGDSDPPSQGGIIHVGTHGELELVDVVLDCDERTDAGDVLSGGALHVDGGLATLDNTAIRGCRAELGGAIYGTNTTLKFRGDSIIEDNEADVGGGLWVQNVGFDTTANTSILVQNNMATMNGGGMAVLSGTAVEVSGFDFHQNEATHRGGGLYLEADTTVGSVLSSNQAGVGGGIAFVDADVGVASALTDNEAHTGGAIHGQGGALTMGAEGSVAGSIAELAAIHTTDSEVTLSHQIFGASALQASTGIVLVATGADLTCTDCSFPRQDLGHILYGTVVDPYIYPSTVDIECSMNHCALIE